MRLLKASKANNTMDKSALAGVLYTSSSLSMAVDEKVSVLDDATLDGEKEEEAFLAKFKRAPSDPRPAWAFQNSETILKEMDSVPLFMTSVPEDCENVPALAALQALLYDEGNDTPLERVKVLKDQGNAAYKAQRYEEAERLYGEALAIDCEDKALCAILYLNRAAVRLSCANYGRVLEDCAEAMRLQPTDQTILDKGRLRSAKASLFLHRPKEALQFLSALSIVNEEAEGLKREASKEAQTEEIAARQRAMRTKIDAKIDRILGARGVRRVSGSQQEKSLIGMLGATCDSNALPWVSFAPQSASRLTWPVLLLYPPYGQSDLLAAADETAPFKEHLDMVFDGESVAPWDTDRLYVNSGGLRLFWHAPETTRIYELPIKKTRLADMMGRLVCEVDRGLIGLHVLPSKGDWVERFLARFESPVEMFSP